MTGPSRSAVRDRLLAAADELFSSEGVQTVGVDRVIDRAGVAKASLYRTFGGKDDLAAAYLGARHRGNLQQLRDAADATADPADGLLAVFAVQGSWLRTPGYRGCPFTRAAAEAPADSLIRAAVDAYRADVRALLVELAERAAVAEPLALARQLEVLFHGAPVLVDGESATAITAAVRTAATALLLAAPRHVEGAATDPEGER